MHRIGGAVSHDGRLTRCSAECRSLRALMDLMDDAVWVVRGQTSEVTTAHRQKRPSLRGAPWRPVALASGAVLGVTLLVAAGLVAALVFAPDPRVVLPEVIAVSLLAHSLGSLGAICVVFRTTGVRVHSLGVTRPSWRLLHLLWQIPATLVAAVAVQALVAALIPGGQEQAGASRLDTALGGARPGILIAAALAITVVTPVWEELYFRGLLQGRITARWGTLVAIIATAVLFAAVHGFLILLPYYLVLGLALSALRVFHRSLWGPLLLHVTVNGIATLVLVASLG